MYKLLGYKIRIFKRFESSAQAFEMSCRTLMFKLLAWITIHISEIKQSLIAWNDGKDVMVN